MLVKEGTNLRSAFQAFVAFRKAADLAPWWADAYWNGSVAADLAGQFSTEEAYLKFYLLIKSGEKDAVQSRLYELEAKRMLAKSVSRSNGIEGYWELGVNNEDSTTLNAKYEIRKIGNSYSVKELQSGVVLSVQSGDNASVSLIDDDPKSFYYRERTVCNLNGDKLICDAIMANGEKYQYSYTKRAQCELVGDDRNMIFGLPVLCK